jgi:hypothetical protein
MIVHYMSVIMLYFIYCLLLLIIEDRLWSCAREMLFKQRLIYHHAYVIRSAMLCFML